ncbi:MAG: biotin/lipoyl-containing protein, partial [Vulcanimicrobiaceae bacterium]
AADGDPAQVGAPLPGIVVRVSVVVGQSVDAGAALLTIEAMKMQSVLYAARRAVVREVFVTPGARVEAGDLLVEFS